MSGKILVIDDELGIRQGCQRALEPQGFEVDKAATIQEGLRKITENHIDLVLIDVMMPDGRGIDILEPIRKIDPDIVCIIITGYATVELAVQAIKEGAYDFISKPFTADMLLITVNQGMEKRRLSLEAHRLQEVEKETARLAHEKEELQRLEQYKSDFMTTVAHELRSPVAGAQSLLRTLMRGLAGGLTEQQKEILSRIDLRMSGLLALVNDLLDLAASKTFEEHRPTEPVQLFPVVRQVADYFSIEADQKGVMLVVDLPAEEIQVLGTEDGMQKIFTNLVGNAIKYTPQGGKVSIGARNCGETVEILIADTGIGIPQKDMGRLFEEFFRASNARRAGIVGTGLGLSIVKQFVDQFGGSIEASSTEGGGTQFKVSLPIQGGNNSYIK
jgi:two-component system, sensor histidine kinase and response regulator